DTEKLVAQVEEFIRQNVPPHDLQLFISELGVTPDWSAAYTPNAGPMDAVVKVQLTEHRGHTAQHYAIALRKSVAAEPKFKMLEVAFDTGGMVRGALNEGKSTPINVRLTGKNQRTLVKIGEQIRDLVKKVPGVVDARIVQRMDTPALRIDVDRNKAA